MSRPPMWTEDRVAGLAAMTKAGLSQAAIARVIGVTKNQVVGALARARKYGRIDVEFNCPYMVAKRRTLEMRERSPKPASVIRDEWFAGGCRWIDADPRDPDWRWCGEPLAPGSAYCRKHLARTGSGIFVKPVRLPRG